MEISKVEIQKNKANSIFLSVALLNIMPRIVKSNRKLYIYDDFIYKLFELEDFKRIFHSFLIDNDITDRWKMNTINEVYQAISACNKIKEVIFNNYTNLICFKNVILNIDTLEKIDHSNEYYFTSYININYDVNAKKCVNFLNFLNSVFTLDNKSPDIESVQTACYIGAYLLYPQNKIKKMFLFLGDGANGKSMLIDVYKMLFPADNITAMSLETLSDEANNNRDGIINSRLNISTEARGKEIESDELKKIISGEDICVIRKYNQAITIKPNVKIIIASNSTPYFADTSYGIERRFYIINFKNKFVDKTEYDQIDPDNRVFPRIEEDILKEQFNNEKSGILNLFIEFLKYLKSHNWIIPQTQNSIESKKEYKENTDILGTWLVENYEKSTDNLEILAEDIYTNYQNYYSNNVSKYGLKLSTTKMGKRIYEIFRIKSFTQWNPMTGKTSKFYKLKERKCQE